MLKQITVSSVKRIQLQFRISSEALSTLRCDTSSGKKGVPHLEETSACVHPCRKPFMAAYSKFTGFPFSLMMNFKVSESAATKNSRNYCNISINRQQTLPMLYLLNTQFTKY